MTASTLHFVEAYRNLGFVNRNNQDGSEAEKGVELTKRYINLEQKNSVNVENGFIFGPAIFFKTDHGRSFAFLKVQVPHLKFNFETEYFDMNLLVENEEHIEYLKQYAFSGGKISFRDARLKHRPKLKERLVWVKSKINFKKYPEKLEELQIFLNSNKHSFYSLEEGFIRVDKSRRRKPPPTQKEVDILNDGAEFYDRIANRTDYSIHYNRRLVQPSLSGFNCEEDYYRVIEDFGLNCDDLQRMYSESIRNEELQEENIITAEFEGYEGCVTVFHLAGLGMKSFKPTNSDNQKDKKAIYRFFAGDAKDYSHFKDGFDTPNELERFFNENLKPEERTWYIWQQQIKSQQNKF